MEEYPSIRESSKAPRLPCIAFNKLDGSNIRVKYTPKQGFALFGTRTQLIDLSTPFWSNAVATFREQAEEPLKRLFTTLEFKNYREIHCFGEFVGPSSMAGRHVDEDPKEFVLFDVLLGHKERKFLPPDKFIKTFAGKVQIPDVVYEGNLNDELIARVRNDEFGLKEGVVCKGIKPRGDYFGHIWMCKIKTFNYLAKIKALYGTDWQKYWE